MAWLNGQWSSSQPKLPNLVEANPCQPGDMIGETDGWIDDDAQVANREWWLRNFSIDDDRAKGTSVKATSWSQPNELGFLCIEFEAVPPLTHTIDAVNESIVELQSVTDETMIVDL